MASRLAAPAALLIALVAVLMLLASGPGTRLGLWDFRTGFWLLRYGAYVGGAAGAVALIFLLIPKTRKGHIAALLLALIVGLVCLALPLQFRARGAVVPPINDLNTDLASAKFAEEQKKGYPDLRTLEPDVPPAMAYSLDVRSRSRVGRSDLGTNARRIRAYLERLK